jgi:glycosyltransferase involved in cell wall biosynthesis
MKIAVVYYAYNEEALVRETLLKSLEAMRSLGESFEIVFIDDGSTDRTGPIAEELSRLHPEIKVYRNEKNCGTGVSALRGLARAQGDLIVHNGIDYPFDLRDLQKMIPLTQETDIVVAVRKSYPGYTPRRRVISRINVALLRLLFPLRLRDYNFTQLYKRKVLNAVKVRSKSAGFVMPETLLRAHALGFKITEIEVEYHAREKGTALRGSTRLVWNALCDLLVYRIESFFSKIIPPKMPMTKP